MMGILELKSRPIMQAFRRNATFSRHNTKQQNKHSNIHTNRERKSYRKIITDCEW